MSFHDGDMQHPMPSLIEDVGQRQRNTVFPDTMKNGSSADALMWHGSPRMTMVQRVGVGLFGLLFILGALSLFSIFQEMTRFWPIHAIPLAFAVVGLRLLRNSLRRNQTGGNAGKHEDDNRDEAASEEPSPEKPPQS